MERARDTDEPALSGKVKLVQEDDHDVQAGVLMYVPVYRHGARTSTVDERRAALLGWVYSPYRMKGLMKGAIGNWENFNSGFLHLQIFDGTKEDAARLLFDNQPGRTPDPRSLLYQRRTIGFKGQLWLLVFYGAKAAAGISYATAWATCAGVSVISVLIFGMLLVIGQRSEALRKTEELAEEIRGMAVHDGLTKLPNRHLLHDRMEMTLAAIKRTGCHAAAMMIDLDNFKPLNDTRGHAAGDKLLIEVARRLASSVRETDTVARLGGDEFVVLLSGLDTGRDASKTQAMAIAEKIRVSLAKPYSVALDQEDEAESPIEHRCTSSIGIAIFRGSEPDPDEIIRRADAAMYAAKKAGCNCIRFGGSDA